MKYLITPVVFISVFACKAQNVGIGTNLPLARLHVADSSVVFTASGQASETPGNAPVSGAGRRLMWYADKAAFRVGYTNGTEWNKDNVGYFSFATGISTKANGNLASFASGYNTVASGETSTAMGLSTIARSANSFVAGRFNDTSNTNRLFEIGNGTSDNSRTNAMTILQNGNVGVGTTSPGFPLNFPNTTGDKIALWGNSNNHYGFGIQSGLLQVHSDAALANIAFGYGSSTNFIERMRIINSGGDGLELSGRVTLRNGTIPLDPGYGPGLWLYKSDNSAQLSFMGAQNNQNVGFYGGPAGWGLTYDAMNSRVGIGNTTPVNRLDVGGLNNWDLTNTEGDMRVGNSSYRLKFGVALNGGGAGTAAIMQAGGAGALNLGANSKNLLQLNGAGNFVDLSNNTGGLRINGNAGTAGQILQSNGNAASPKWVTKPYFMTLQQAVGQYSFIELTGIGVTSVPIPGMDNQSILIPEASRVMANISGFLYSTAQSGTVSAKIRIEIWESSTNTLKLTLVASGWANGYDGTTLNLMDMVDLNPGFHQVRAYFQRGYPVYSGDSQLFRSKLIWNIIPQ